MASNAKPGIGAAPEVVGQIILVPVSDIVIGKRLRPVDPTWASALGKIMAAEGQKTPIEICRLPGKSGWTLVAGAHRHAGAIEAGIVYLRAIVVENDVAERLNREISENLWRRGLDPLDRAAFIAELVTLHKVRNGVDPEADGRAVSAATRWQQALKDEADDANVTMTFAYGWADGIAERLGFSRSAIERDLHLHRRIPAGLIAKLRAYEGGLGHPALKNGAQLRMLAKLDEDQQTAAIDKLLWVEATSNTRKAMTLSEAIAANTAKRPAADDAKLLSRFTGTFARMSLPEKKGALSQLNGMLPAGYRISYGEQQTAKGFPEDHERYREEALAAIDDARAALLALMEDADGGGAVRIDGDRYEEMHQAATKLQMARFSICADAFELGAKA